MALVKFGDSENISVEVPSKKLVASDATKPPVAVRNPHVVTLDRDTIS